MSPRTYSVLVIIFLGSILGGWPTRASIHTEAAPLVVVFDEWALRTPTLLRSDLITRSCARAVLLSGLR